LEYGLSREPLSEDWRDWIPEAHQMIEEWEAETKLRMLSTHDATRLAEGIARALQAAFERGLRS
jgi:hypothetical protein